MRKKWIIHLPQKEIIGDNGRKEGGQRAKGAGEMRGKRNDTKEEKGSFHQDSKREGGRRTLKGEGG